jgi:acetylornithine deacetylase/succinyl-diaminopimelate desuccinylase-like protein
MLTVTGFTSGYTGEGYNNIVPSTAEARINFRFVKSQKPQKILKAFKEFVKKNTPNYVDFEISETPSWEALKIDTKSEAAQDIKRVLEKSYGEKAVFRFVGGSIPVIGFFVKFLTSNVMSIPLVNEDCNMHGVNENFRIDLLKKALKFSRSFFSND